MMPVSIIIQGCRVGCEQAHRHPTSTLSKVHYVMVRAYMSQGRLVGRLQQPRDDDAQSSEHALRSRSSRYTPRPIRPQWIDHRLIEPLDIWFWSNIYSVEIPSDECLSKVRSLLSCPTKITVARSFRGNEAQRLIDFLDRVSKSLLPPVPPTQGIKYRFLRGHASMTNYGSGVYDFFLRFAKPAGSYPLLMFFNGDSYSLGGFVSMAGSQT